MGLPHEDPQQHILNFFEISDTYITNGVTQEYVKLRLFPFSMLGKAKRWLKTEPANSIISWNGLARKILARFFPSGKTVKIRTHTFIEGLHPETKIVVDAAVGGQVLVKSFDEIYALLNKFSKSNHDWQGEMGIHTVQKSAGVLKLDVVSALSAQISTLTKQVNQMTLVINKQQAQPVQQAQAAAMRNLERQMGQLASAQNTRPIGALPCDTEPNPKAQVNAVTLRNGRVLEEVPKKKKYTTSPEGELVPKPVEKNEKENKGSEPEVPKYARYLRDIMANKRRHTEFEIVALTKEYEKVPIILGQPFLDTGGAIIDVREGKLKIRVDDEEITFNVYKDT
ncbi:uncharacterized protein [Nicotiana tomentosiformis]|uniref:uncharacterized protein n=1 Tax=Nicotiana tomentosiformis TaxID=4098 RepID=UPI00388C606E